MNENTNPVEENVGVEQQMEQPVEAQKTAEVETPKGRAALRSRYSERHPDTNWSEADDDALADQAIADYDSLNERLKAHEDNDKKLTELFDKNPQSAGFLMGMANGEDFLVNLQKNFGEDIVAAMQDPEKLEELSKANKEYMQRAAKSKELQKQWETNMEATLQRLQDEQDANGLSDADVESGMDALEKVVSEYLNGDISTETLQLFLKGASHDADVEAARHNGEVEGRNAKINEQLRTRKNDTDGVPSLGGQSNRNAQGKRIDRDHLRGENTGTNIWQAGGFKRNNYD